MQIFSARAAFVKKGFTLDLLHKPKNMKPKNTKNAKFEANVEIIVLRFLESQLYSMVALCRI